MLDYSLEPDTDTATTDIMSIAASTSTASTSAPNGDANGPASTQRGEAELKALLARETGVYLTQQWPRQHGS